MLGTLINGIIKSVPLNPSPYFLTFFSLFNNEPNVLLPLWLSKYYTKILVNKEMGL